MGNSCSNEKTVTVYHNNLSTSDSNSKPNTITSFSSSRQSVAPKSKTPAKSKTKFTIGKFDSYFDLPLAKDVHRPGWTLESGNILSYCILMEESVGVKLLRRLKHYPRLCTLPEPCTLTFQRCKYKAYNVVVFRLSHSENNKVLIERCVRKLRTSGPAEFDNIMTFYGTDNVVFNDWINEERSLRALSSADGMY